MIRGEQGPARGEPGNHGQVASLVRDAYLAGRLTEAVKRAGEAAVPGGAAVTGAGRWLVLAHLEAGDLDAAGRVLDAAAGDLRSERGLLREARGDLPGALADHLDHGAAAPAYTPDVPWRSRAALVHHRLGEPTEAARLAAEELAAARELGAPRPVAVSLRALGVVTGDVGALAGSAVLLAESPARLEYAHTLYHLGDAYLSAGRIPSARETLRQAYLLAAQCGARPLTDRSGELLGRAGGRRPRTVRTGLAALTRQELACAERAAAGATNQEIADDLFVTRRTVETHLTWVYRKLGISGRAELADALANLRLPD